MRFLIKQSIRHQEQRQWPLYLRAYAVLREEGVLGLAHRLHKQSNSLQYRLGWLHHDTMYNNTEFFDHPEPIYWDAFSSWAKNTFKPNSVLDVGCGNGYLMKSLSNIGIDAFDIEGSSVASEIF